MSSETTSSPLATTALVALHRELGARMVPFAGYDMPVQYPTGILAEHLHTRAHAGLFDVAHMGQAFLSGVGVAEGLETLMAGDLKTLAEGRTRYSQLLDAQGHILDDLMVTRLVPRANGDEHFFLVVNAAMKEQDFALIAKALPKLTLTILHDRALLALQGPEAAPVLARFLPDVAHMPFMSWRSFASSYGELYVTRSGYTGEDGYEISVANEHAQAFARALLREPEVKPIGLGARDSLRLEAGLCLYGHDIDTTTNPIEAALVWSISKRRRAEGGFPGSSFIQHDIAHGPSRLRMGLLPEGRAVAREGSLIFAADGQEIGCVTSGGFSPSLNRPIAMGYIASSHAQIGAEVYVQVRQQKIKAVLSALPFVPTRFYRGS
jgi:aminomethyltransferase